MAGYLDGLSMKLFGPLYWWYARQGLIERLAFLLFVAPACLVAYKIGLFGKLFGG